MREGECPGQQVVQTVSPDCWGAAEGGGQKVRLELLEVLLEVPEPRLDVGLALDGLRDALLQGINALLLSDVQVFPSSLLSFTLDLFL